MDKSNNTEKTYTERPEPTNLLAYLPWACAQLQLPKDVLINRNQQHEYVSAMSTERARPKGKSKARLPSVTDREDPDKESASVSQAEGDVIRITAICDYVDNLLALRFEKNSSLPRMLMQILGLIIKFHVNLYSITINQGMNKYILYEIVSFLPDSRITDLCFDNCFLAEGTYYTLLENTSNLRYLSLSRCRINDETVALLAAQLCHPKPGSASLVILNLSSNRITDVGAESIRNALKMNMKLAYLNLADNMITDNGVASILNVLQEFPLLSQEVLEMRSRHIDYLRNRHSAVIQTARDLQISEMVKKKADIRTSRPKSISRTRDDHSLNSEKTVCNTDAQFYEKAQAMVNNMMPFRDPYSADNITSRDGVIYCLGNNYLSSLNVSYNNLTYASIVKVLEVLTYQKDMDRKPRGLMSVRVEGNALPACRELVQIEELLENALAGSNKRAAIKKKGK